MSDDSETVEDTKKGSLTEVTDDSCAVEFIEIVPLDRASSDNVSNHTSVFLDRGVEVKPEDLQQMKQEPVDENDDVPLDRASDDVSNHTSGFLDRVVEVKLEDLQEMKPEPMDENDEDTNYSVKQEPGNDYETEGQCYSLPVSSLMFN